jgi:hypothetical protein
MKLSQPKMIRLGLVLAGLVAVYVIFSSYSASKATVVDKAEELGGTGATGPLSEQGPSMGFPHSVGGNAASAQSMQGRTPSSQQTYTESTLSSSELLPKSELGASFAAVNPAGMEDLKGQNFLQAAYHSNINIVGIAQTNRNPTYDIRSEVPNPQAKVGPFNNSTYDHDPFKETRGLEGLTA